MCPTSDNLTCTIYQQTRNPLLQFNQNARQQTRNHRFPQIQTPNPATNLQKNPNGMPNLGRALNSRVPEVGTRAKYLNCDSPPTNCSLGLEKEAPANPPSAPRVLLLMPQGTTAQSNDCISLPYSTWVYQSIPRYSMTTEMSICIQIRVCIGQCALPRVIFYVKILMLQPRPPPCSLVPHELSLSKMSSNFFFLSLKYCKNYFGRENSGRRRSRIFSLGYLYIFGPTYFFVVDISYFGLHILFILF